VGIANWKSLLRIVWQRQRDADRGWDFIIENIRKQIDLGVNTDSCFCFGNGKNEKFLRKLNEQEKFFKNIIALEHPMFIMQYKAPSKAVYIKKYIDAFESVL
jgi:hypothetical protein